MGSRLEILRRLHELPSATPCSICREKKFSQIETDSKINGQKVIAIICDNCHHIDYFLEDSDAD